MTALILTCCLAIVLGFSAHRASLCTVRAVAELMSSRRAYMLVSIGKSVMWMMAVSLPVLWLFPTASAHLGGWPLTSIALLGGFLFGAGAALNGACAYSTMTRLINGDGGMFVAVLGFAAGVLCFAALAGAQVIPRPSPTPALVGAWIGWALVPGLAALAWGVYEIVRLWRTRPIGTGFGALMLARQYRLSSAAMLMGLTGALLFLAHGTGGYSSTFQSVIEGMVGTRPYPATARWVLLAGVLAGMILSSIEQRAFRIDWRPRRAWLRNLLG